MGDKKTPAGSLVRCVRACVRVRLCVYIYILFSSHLVVKYDSYFGVLMAYGGLQDVSGSRLISLINGEIIV